MPPDAATSWEWTGILQAHASFNLANGALQGTHQTEQRRHRRYLIELDTEFELLSKGRVELIGYARTLNISSGGILLSANDSLPAGGLIKLAVNWPFLLEGVCLLRLMVRGRIVRSDDKRVAVQSTHYEFRTAGVRTYAAIDKV
jgi:hypothetical protein